MEENGLINAIFSAIPESETNFIMDSCVAAAEAIYKYNNSAYGLLENIKNNADTLNIDMEKIMQTINNPESLTFVKKLMDTELSQ